jgi:hypothetical protein
MLDDGAEVFDGNHDVEFIFDINVVKLVGFNSN